jgi:hypothetical protein
MKAIAQNVWIADSDALVGRVRIPIRMTVTRLRDELANFPDIHVCSVFPAMVDTPGFVHGANVSGRALSPAPFLYQAEDVAQTFVRLARRPRAETAVGWPARAAQISYSMAPRPTEYLLGSILRFLLRRQPEAARFEGALMSPVAAGTATSGGWLARKQLPSAGQITRVCVFAGMLAVGTFIAAKCISQHRSSRNETDA